MKGLGSPDSLVEMKPLLAFVPASSIVEAGSPRLLDVGSSQTD
ncbi:MAG: hypothetical protein QXG01_06725 [Candidatus Bathyarchaeia archaeon]